MGLWTILVVVCLPFAVISQSQTSPQVSGSSTPKGSEGTLIPIDHQRCLSLTRQTRYVTLPMPYLCRPGKPGGIPVPDKMNSQVAVVLFGLHNEGFRLCQHEIKVPVHKYIPVPVCCPGWAKDPVGGCTISSYLMKKGFCLNGGIPVMKKGPPTCVCAPTFSGSICQFKTLPTSQSRSNLRNSRPMPFIKRMMPINSGRVGRPPFSPRYQVPNAVNSPVHVAPSMARRPSRIPPPARLPVPLNQMRNPTMMKTPAMMHNNPGMMRNNPGMMRNNPGMMRNNPGMMHNHPSMMRNNPSMMRNNPSMMRNNPSMMNANMMPMPNSARQMQQMMSKRGMMNNIRPMPQRVMMMPTNRRMMPGNPGMRSPMQYGVLVNNRNSQNPRGFSHPVELPLNKMQMMRARVSPDGQSILVPCRRNPRMYHIVSLRKPISSGQLGPNQRLHPAQLQRLMAEKAKHFTGIPNTLPPKIMSQVSNVINSARKINPMINPAAINPVPSSNYPRPVVAPPVVISRRPGVPFPQNQPQIPRRVQMMMGDNNGQDRCRQILEVGVSRCFREAGIIAAPSDIFNPQNPSLAGRICGLGGRIGPCIMAGETACGGGMRIMLTRRMLSQLLGAISSFCQSSKADFGLNLVRGRTPPGPMVRNNAQQTRFQPPNTGIPGPANTPQTGNMIPDANFSPGEIRDIPRGQMPPDMSGFQPDPNSPPSGIDGFEGRMNPNMPDPNMHDLSMPVSNMPDLPQPNAPEDPRNIIADGPNSEVLQPVGTNPTDSTQPEGSLPPPQQQDFNLEGQLRNLVIDPPLDCFNGGEVVPEEGIAVCACPVGFTGVQCEIQLEETISPEEPMPMRPTEADPTLLDHFDPSRPSRLDVNTETELAHKAPNQPPKIVHESPVEAALPSAGDINTVVDKERVVSDAGSLAAQANSAESSQDYSKKENLEVAGFPLWMVLAIALGFLFVMFIVCLTLCLCIRCRRTKSAEITQLPEKVPIPDSMFTISAMPPTYESQGIHPLSYEEAKGETIYASVKKDKKEEAEEVPEKEKDKQEEKEEENIDV